MSNLTKICKKIALNFLLIIFSVTACIAQDYVFKIMATNGNIIQKKSAKRLWAGAQLQGNEVINIPNKGYIGLMHKNGRTIELKQAGDYKISDLAKKLGGHSSITSKYANYMYEQMTKADKVDINKHNRRYKSITRSLRCNFVFESVLAYFPYPKNPDIKDNEFNAVYDGTEFVLHFYPDPETNKGIEKFDSYFVSISDMTNKEVTRFETKEESMKIDLTKLTFKYMPTWELNVSRSAKTFKRGDNSFHTSTSYSVSLLEKEDALYKSVTRDLKEIGEATTALYKLTQARVFEEHKLLQDAIRCYEQAIAMQPEVTTFRIIYDEFLVRNRIRYAENPDFKEDIMKDEAKIPVVVGKRNLPLLLLKKVK